jgi:hypothetical protein
LVLVVQVLLMAEPQVAVMVEVQLLMLLPFWVVAVAELILVPQQEATERQAVALVVSQVALRRVVLVLMAATVERLQLLAATGQVAVVAVVVQVAELDRLV